MTAAHPSQPGYVPARLVAAASAHRGRHKAGLWSPFEKRHVAMLQSEAGVLGAVHRGVLTDSDLVLLEDLDFELPCEITRDAARIECPLTAGWLVVARTHCRDVVVERLMCTMHYNHLTSGGTWNCITCGLPNIWRDHVIRTERIKP